MTRFAPAAILAAASAIAPAGVAADAVVDQAQASKVKPAVKTVGKDTPMQGGMKKDGMTVADMK